MRLGWSKNKYSTSYYVQKTVYVNGKNKSIVVKRLGSEKYICETYGVSDAKAWAKEQVALMNKEEQEENASFTIELNAGIDLPLDHQQRFNGGYLFIQQIYYELGLDKICKAIKTRHRFQYNLNSIFSRLIYTRILYPGSKLSSYRDSFRFIEQPDFDLQHIYRALSVIAEESDYIQSRLFKNSMKLSTRRTEIIYYDCTNFYFEIEQAVDDRQYGISKENRPLPVVELGLFMDRDGIPISFCIHPGNTNEQETMIPLEKKMIDHFDLSRFVVCTDAGLSSGKNRFFNSFEDEKNSRDFITTQSVKKLKKFLKDWALDKNGWKLAGCCSEDEYNIEALDEERDTEKIFYKSRWIREKIPVKENGKTKKVEMEQQLIVSYSLKYRNYQRKIRKGQIERAQKAVQKGSAATKRKNQNDPKRFIKTDYATKDGEVASKKISYIDNEMISREAMYDGFYAVCTSLDDDPEEIVKVNKHRWQIEECFRIMKHEFLSRPAFVSLEDHIRAHFLSCFVALTVYRYLEKRLDDRYTCSQIVDTLCEMDFVKYEGKGYQPIYTRTELTDTLHEAFDFCTSKQIIPVKKMRNICSQTKK